MKKSLFILILTLITSYSYSEETKLPYGAVMISMQGTEKVVAATWEEIKINLNKYGCQNQNTWIPYTLQMPKKHFGIISWHEVWALPKCKSIDSVKIKFYDGWFSELTYEIIAYNETKIEQ
jgi:hypothetical protein